MTKMALSCCFLSDEIAAVTRLKKPRKNASSKSVSRGTSDSHRPSEANSLLICTNVLMHHDNGAVADFLSYIALHQNSRK